MLPGGRVGVGQVDRAEAALHRLERGRVAGEGQRVGVGASLDVPRRIEVGPVCIDLDAGLVTRWGEPVPLTPTEYILLEILATSGGRLCTSRVLSERLWGPGSEHKSRSLREHVASLRRKLDDPSVPELLVAEPGMGYRFVVPT